MTVINVTDATLKGDVAGPTFTGKVDGSKFSGSVTYTDSTTPPVDPPPSGEIVIPSAPITGFTTRNESTFNIGGKPYWLETPGKDWNISQVDNNTLRFEIRKGDHFTSSYYNDPTTSERCEVSCKVPGVQVPPGGTVLLQHRIMWELGTPSKTTWNVFSQFHELDVSNSPPYKISLSNDRMQIDIGVQSPQFIFQDDNPIERGRWYTIQSEIKWDTRNGFVRVKRDGVQIANYTGAVGTGVAHYPKFGIYRYTTAETVAVQYRDWTVSVK